MDRTLIGVDVGGTFTDAVVVLPRGRIFSAKVLTTADQSHGVLAAVSRVLAEAGIVLADDRDVRFANGTTVATNALLERRLAPTAAVFTEGFEDLLELRRQDRPSLFHPLLPPPVPLVPRTHVVGANARLHPTGILAELTPAAIAAVVDALRDLAVESVAICLLHSWLDPRHEQQLAAAIREQYPGLHVVASTELTRELREYERATTTVIDAGVTPVLQPYLMRLQHEARAAHLPAPLVMTSSGGLDQLERVAGHAVRAVLSGPAGGVVAAQQVHATGGFADVDGFVCIDVGGTSCDVAVVGAERIERGAIRHVAGQPILLDMVDIDTVAVGGSSILTATSGATIMVGPRSAGSVPGPACYGRGGDQPTLTDAHVVAGNLQAGTLTHWGIEIDERQASTALESLAIGDVRVVAAAAIEQATVQMAEAARAQSVRIGMDPAQLVVLAYGGAGALHACDIADELGCTRVLVPQHAGAFSALGLACANVRREATRSVCIEHDTKGKPSSTPELLRSLSGSLATCERDIGGNDDHGQLVLSMRADMRFHGQSHAIPVYRHLQGSSPAALRAALESAHTDFLEAHRDRYGYVLQTAVETIAVRLSAEQVTVTADTIAHESPVPAARAISSSASTAHDLPTGTLLVPDNWHLHGVRAGCIDIRRAGE